MTSTFIPELEYKTQLRAHEKNPRRRAKADQEMVDSVKASGLITPLLVAPTGDEAVPYVLIDGHRRLDALKRAKATTAPALVREDLTAEGDQIQTMLLAALYREGLSPLEQAEGFEELSNLRGWTQKKIAQSTGVPVTTVRDRMKLLKLSKATQNRIHKGQLTLGDAMDLVAFDDDPETQAKLVKAAGTYEWDYALQSAKRQRKAIAHADDVEAQLQAQGVAKIELEDPSRSWYQTRNMSDGPVEVDATHSTDPADHDGCYGYLRTSTYDGDPEIRLVCTAPGSHEITETAQQRERRLENEERQAKQAADTERRAIARDVRVTVVQKVAADVVLPAPVVDLLRSLLPHLVLSLDYSVGPLYAELLELPEAVTRTAVGYNYGDAREQFDAHAADLTTATPARLTRVMVAVLVAAAESNLTVSHLTYGPLVERYYTLLEQLDHHRTDVDDEILAQHRAEQGDDEAEESAS